MYARLTRVQGPPDVIEAGIQLVKEQVIPAARQIDGFKGGYWALDRSTGTMIALTLFTDQGALKDSRTTADKIRAEATEKIGAEIQSVEEFEIVAEA